MLEFLEKSEFSELYSTCHFVGRRTLGFDAKTVPAAVSSCKLLSVGADTVGCLVDVQHLCKCRYGSESAR